MQQEWKFIYNFFSRQGKCRFDIIELKIGMNDIETKIASLGQIAIEFQ